MKHNPQYSFEKRVIVILGTKIVNNILITALAPEAVKSWIKHHTCSLCNSVWLSHLPVSQQAWKKMMLVEMEHIFICKFYSYRGLIKTFGFFTIKLQFVGNRELIYAINKISHDSLSPCFLLLLWWWWWWWW